MATIKFPQPVARRLCKQPEVQSMTGLPSSSMYDRIKRGLFMSPVKIGERARGWPSDEIDQYIRAIVQGAPDDELRALVSELIAQRTEGVNDEVF